MKIYFMMNLMNLVRQKKHSLLKKRAFVQRVSTGHIFTGIVLVMSSSATEALFVPVVSFRRNIWMLFSTAWYFGSFDRY
jgi:hypothetical protein